jgi:hypothetical protein
LCKTSCEINTEVRDEDCDNESQPDEGINIGTECKIRESVVDALSQSEKATTKLLCRGICPAIPNVNGDQLRVWPREDTQNGCCLASAGTPAECSCCSSIGAPNSIKYTCIDNLRILMESLL